MARRRGGVAEVAVRPYWREAEARIVVDAWRESGESMRGFAARHGFQAARLGRWVKRLGGAGREAAAGISFLPVRLRAADEPKSTRLAAVPRIAVVRGDGTRVEIADGFDDSTLRRVLGLLAERSSW